MKRDDPHYMRDWNRRKRLEDPDYMRRQHLLREYGITMEQFYELKRQQGGVCAICGRVAPGTYGNNKELHVDHDHRTGRIRGLLCPPCNKALGLLGDTLEQLKKAVAYLERSES